MKNTKLKFLVAAALMGLSHAAQAETPSVSEGKFTPLEQLSTDQRIQYEQLIRELMTDRMYPMTLGGLERAMRALSAKR